MNTMRRVATGSGALDFTFPVAAGLGECVEVLCLTLRVASAPTTSETLVVTLDSGAGPEFDAVLSSVNPATAALTSLVWLPDAPLYLSDGDALDVRWLNTDARVFGLTVLARGV